MRPIISIIVPVYNTEKYLDQCIQSVLAQTYTNWELLLIDDGSTDSSGAICDKYAAEDNRIRVFHKENGGVSSARNLGLDNAQGEWISFVDADDCEVNFARSAKKSCKILDFFLTSPQYRSNIKASSLKGEPRICSLLRIITFL